MTPGVGEPACVHSLGGDAAWWQHVFEVLAQEPGEEATLVEARAPSGDEAGSRALLPPIIPRKHRLGGIIQ